MVMDVDMIPEEDASSLVNTSKEEEYTKLEKYLESLEPEKTPACKEIEDSACTVKLKGSAPTEELEDSALLEQLEDSFPTEAAPIVKVSPVVKRGRGRGRGRGKGRGRGRKNITFVAPAPGSESEEPEDTAPTEEFEETAALKELEETAPNVVREDSVKKQADIDTDLQESETDETAPSKDFQHTTAEEFEEADHHDVIQGRARRKITDLSDSESEEHEESVDPEECEDEEEDEEEEEEDDDEEEEAAASEELEEITFHVARRGRPRKKIKFDSDLPNSGSEGHEELEDTAPFQVKKYRGRKRPKVDEDSDVQSEDLEEPPLPEIKPGRGRKKIKVEEELPNLKSEDLLQGYRIIADLQRTHRTFLYPPNPEGKGMGYYFEVVKQPIWLQEIERKLVEEIYTSFSEFLADMCLLLENCYRYFGPDSTPTKRALRLEDAFRQRLRKLPKHLCCLGLDALDNWPNTVLHNGNTNGVMEYEVTATKETEVSGDTEFISNILSRVAGDRSKRDLERTVRVAEERRIEAVGREREILDWDESVLMTPELRQQMKYMWELPQIGLFVYLALDVLNIDEIPQYQIERMVFMPQASTTLARLMTTLLVSPLLRSRLIHLPPMSYRIWTRKLYSKVSSWYKLYYRMGYNANLVFERYGIEPDFWKVLGEWNQLEEYEFHELSLHQRVWLIKSLCDFIMQNQKTVRDQVSDPEVRDKYSYSLGQDRYGCHYLHFPEMCGDDIRVYRQALSAKTLWERDEEYHDMLERKRQEEEEAAAKAAEEAAKAAEAAKAEAAAAAETAADTEAASTEMEANTPKRTVLRRGRKRKRRRKFIKPVLHGKIDDDNNSDVGERFDADENSVTINTANDTADTSDVEKFSQDSSINKDGDDNLQNNCANSESHNDNLKNFNSSVLNNSEDLGDKKKAGVSVMNKVMVSPCSSEDFVMDMRQFKHIFRSEDISSFSKVRRPIYNPAWLAPDGSEFEMVADSFESLTELIKSFSENDDEDNCNLMSRLSNKVKAVKPPRCEVLLAQKLQTLAKELEPWEVSFITATRKNRTKMFDEWEAFEKRPDDYVDPGEAIWLDQPEPQETVEEKVEDLQDSLHAFTDVLPGENEDTNVSASEYDNRRTLRVRAAKRKCESTIGLGVRSLPEEAITGDVSEDELRIFNSVNSDSESFEEADDDESDEWKLPEKRKRTPKIKFPGFRGRKRKRDFEEGGFVDNPTSESAQQNPNEETKLVKKKKKAPTDGSGSTKKVKKCKTIGNKDLSPPDGADISEKSLLGANLPNISIIKVPTDGVSNKAVRNLNKSNFDKMENANSGKKVREKLPVKILKKKQLNSPLTVRSDLNIKTEKSESMTNCSTYIKIKDESNTFIKIEEQPKGNINELSESNKMLIEFLKPTIKQYQASERYKKALSSGEKICLHPYLDDKGEWKVREVKSADLPERTLVLSTSEALQKALNEDDNQIPESSSRETSATPALTAKVTTSVTSTVTPLFTPVETDNNQFSQPLLTAQNQLFVLTTTSIQTPVGQLQPGTSTVQLQPITIKGPQVKQVVQLTPSVSIIPQANTSASGVENKLPQISIIPKEHLMEKPGTKQSQSDVIYVSEDSSDSVEFVDESPPCDSNRTGFIKKTSVPNAPANSQQTIRIASFLNAQNQQQQVIQYQTSPMSVINAGGQRPVQIYASPVQPGMQVMSSPVNVQVISPNAAQTYRMSPASQVVRANLQARAASNLIASPRTPRVVMSSPRMQSPRIVSTTSLRMPGGTPTRMPGGTPARMPGTPTRMSLAATRTPGTPTRMPVTPTRMTLSSPRMMAASPRMTVASPRMASLTRVPSTPPRMPVTSPRMQTTPPRMQSLTQTASPRTPRGGYYNVANRATVSPRGVVRGQLTQQFSQLSAARPGSSPVRVQTVRAQAPVRGSPRGRKPSFTVPVITPSKSATGTTTFRNQSPVSNNTQSTSSTISAGGTAKIIAMADSSGLWYALQFPTGSKIKLTPDQVADIRAKNGGVLPSHI